MSDLTGGFEMTGKRGWSVNAVQIRCDCPAARHSEVMTCAGWVGGVRIGGDGQSERQSLALTIGIISGEIPHPATRAG